MNKKIAPWFWEPKEDITIFELAAAMSVLLPAAGGGLPEDRIGQCIEELPYSVHRHFQKPERDSEAG